jgi:quercetin dioxygenase-like cupin family protein
MQPQSLKDVLSELAMGDFRELGRVDDRIAGVFRSPADSWLWERHPDGDELLHILEGDLEITLLQENGAERTELGAGTVFVVPRGVWHRPHALSDVSVFFVTPEGTESSTADDPRLDPTIQVGRI